MQLSDCSILKGVGQIRHSPPQGPTGCPDFLARIASNPAEINENQWKSMKINENSFQMHPYASVCIHMEPNVAICTKKTWFNCSHVAKAWKNLEITQMTFLPMGYMQNFNANPMTHSKSSRIPYMIKTNMQKKKSAAEAEPINAPRQGSALPLTACQTNHDVVPTSSQLSARKKTKRPSLTL